MVAPLCFVLIFIIFGVFALPASAMELATNADGAEALPAASAPAQTEQSDTQTDGDDSSVSTASDDSATADGTPAPTTPLPKTAIVWPGVNSLRPATILLER